MRLRLGTSGGHDDAAVVAGQLGFTYSRTDPGNVLGLPFRLFAQGSGRKVSDFVFGQHAGQSAEMFVLEGQAAAEVPHGSGISTTVVGPTTYTCAVVGIPADFPNISITRRADSAVLQRDADEMQFESEAFNQAFRVHSASEKAAFSLIDGRMMEWLTTQPIPFVTIEVAGPWWFATLPRIEPSGWPVFLSLYDQFGAYVPPVALSTFPRRSA